MRYLFLFAAALLLLSGSIRAQSPARPYHGKIMAEDGSAVPGAAVRLLKDSVQVKFSLSDTSGAYQFHQVPNGKYLLQASTPGFEKFSLPIRIPLADGSQKLPDIILKLKLEELSAVVVTAAKPVYEMHGDKIVYNVSSSINSQGINALEILRKSPGVSIDHNNNISLNGKSGVNIYIDGKPSYMQGEAVAAMLKSLQASNVQSIELMANPSSRYDAGGTGGIINIRLKKLNGTGYNADVSAGFHYGTSPKTEAAFNANYKTEKYNLYASYNHYFGNNNMYYDYFRMQESQIFDTRNLDKDMRNPVNFKTGIDINLNEKNTVGAMVNGNLYFGPGLTNTTTFIKEQGSGQLQGILSASNDYYSQRQNWMNYNANYQYKDTLGTHFSADMDYGRYHALIKNILANTNKDTEGNPVNSFLLRTINGSNIDIYGLKADYEKPIGKHKFSAGIKSSFVDADNDVNAFDVLSSGEQLNIMRSNLFSYREDIYAAYASMEFKIGKLQLRTGARLENTSTKGILDAKSKTTLADTTEIISSNYLDLFPNVGLTYRLKGSQALSAAYSKRIERPSYASLNPFEYLLDEFSYWKGNAFLKPQYVHNFSFSYTHSSLFSGTLGYSRISDFFSQVTDTAGSGTMVMMPRNIGRQGVLNLSLASILHPSAWLETNLNTNVFYKKNDMLLDALRQAETEKVSFTLNVQNVFTLGRNTKAELSGFYASPAIHGFNESNKAYWMVDAGIQQKIMQGRGNIKLAVSDIFKTFRWDSVRSFDGFYFSNIGGRDSRQLKISLAYRLGNSRAAADGGRDSGLEGESQRVK